MGAEIAIVSACEPSKIPLDSRYNQYISIITQIDIDIYLPEAILPWTCWLGADVLPLIYFPNRSERAKGDLMCKKISWPHAVCDTNILTPYFLPRIETACNVWHGADLDS